MIFNSGPPNWDYTVRSNYSWGNNIPQTDIYVDSYHHPATEFTSSYASVRPCPVCVCMYVCARACMCVSERESVCACAVRVYTPAWRVGWRGTSGAIDGADIFVINLEICEQWVSYATK